MALSAQATVCDGNLFAADLARLIPNLRSLARLLCRNEDSAADLTQETLAKAWQARNSFVPGTNLKGWLYTIMRNQFRSEARRAWRKMPWDDQAAERITAPGLQQIWTLDLKDAVRAMNSLSKRQRDAVILAGVGGLSSEDGGAVVACRPTAIKTRVSRARQSMLAMLNGRAPLRSPRAKGNVIEQLGEELEQLTAHSLLRSAPGIATP